MAATATAVDWGGVAAALTSPKLTDEERQRLLKLSFADKREVQPLIKMLGGADALRDSYFSDWRYTPNAGPQTALMFSPADEVFYGGARGGGKSFGFLLHFLDHALTWGRLARGVIFRRRFVDLEDLIRDSWEIFGPLNGKFFAGGGRPSWRVPGGGELRLRYLKNERDAVNYQGQAFTRIYVEEAGTYGTPTALDLLRGCLRSAHGVPCQLLLNANPGGPGHNMLKSRYIDPAPPNTLMEEEIEIRKGEFVTWTRMFIPAKLADNPPLDTAQYRASLKLAGPEYLVKAWLDGDWDIVAGGMFDDILSPTGKQRIVIEPFEIPPQWQIYRAFDWGSAKPFSVGWWAVSDGSAVYDGERLVGKWPARSLFRVAEWYGSSGNPDNPNEGLRMLASDVGERIRARERELFPGRTVLPGPADSAIYVSDGVARSIADEMKDPKGDGSRKGVTFVPSDKGAGSRKSGWEALRRVLRNAAPIDDNGNPVPPENPGMWIFGTCRHWVRTMTVLPRNSPESGLDVEDVDTDSEDHIADETRYMLTTKRPTVSTEEWRV
jgi:hypothetical protein